MKAFRWAAAIVAGVLAINFFIAIVNGATVTAGIAAIGLVVTGWALVEVTTGRR